MPETLKPCPFCGSTDLYINGDTVCCDSCTAHAYWSSEDREDDAIKAWNRRADGWIPFDPENPPKSDCIIYHDKIGVQFCYHCEWEASSWVGHITHYMLLPGPPEVTE